MKAQQIMAAGDPGSTDIWALANSPVLWLCALGVFAVIFVQCVLYKRAVKKAAPHVDMPLAEVKESFRAGAVASIGPSLAVVLVAIALLALFGTPAVLVRIGLIGSAAAETGSASISASTMGAALGGETYTQQVFGVAFMAMSLSGAIWMICTLIMTPLLKKGGNNLAKRNPAVMALVPTAALLGAFSALTIAELPKVQRPHDSGLHLRGHDGLVPLSGQDASAPMDEGMGVGYFHRRLDYCRLFLAHRLRNHHDCDTTTFQR